MKGLKTKKWLLIVFSLSLLVVLVGFTSSTLATLEVSLKPIFFNVDGENVSASDQPHQYYNGKEYLPETILYKGTTYIPIRFAGELVGAEVNWDGETDTVSINKKVEAIETLNEFTLVLDERLSEEERAYVEQVKTSPGIHQQGNLVVIALGEKPNPGYGIEFVKQEMSWEQLKVYIKQTKPDPNQMYAQVISYPYLVAKVDLPPYTTLQIMDAETEKPFVFEGEAKTVIEAEALN